LANYLVFKVIQKIVYKLFIGFYKLYISNCNKNKVCEIEKSYEWNGIFGV